MEARVSVSFLLALVQRGAGVNADPESRPRARAAIDNTFEILDDADEEQDDVPVTGASASGESVPVRPSIAPVGDVDAPRTSDAADDESRASLPSHVEPFAEPAVPQRSRETEKNAVRASALETVRFPENDRSMGPKGQVQATSRAIHVSGPAVWIRETQPDAQRTATDPPPAADAIVPAASVESIARRMSIEPLVPWMPRADAAGDPSWPESDEVAREKRVEVRIGRIEIVQPPARGPVQPPARRKPRGFDSLQAARRYVDRRWY
jgi:hypothetical protein